MNNIKLIYIFFILINGCQYNLNNQPESIIKQETKWANTDEHPSTVECDKIIDKKSRIQCFNSYISDLFVQNIMNDLALENSNFNDTIFFELTFDSNGKIIVESIIGNNEIVSLIDEIKKKVETLPNILPATKTNLGIAVKSKIKLPIIFKSD
jgi:hypothetical protein